MILIASANVHLFPAEINSGLTFVRVRTTAPTVSVLSFNKEYVPFSNGGCSNVPISLLLAQPIVGLLKKSPRWAAKPNLLG